MKTKIPYLAILIALLFGCKKNETVPIPSSGPYSILDETYPLTDASKQIMDGVYQVSEGSDFFGEQVVVKWNRTNLLIACDNGKYFVLGAGRLDSVIFLDGYWRNGYSDGTGATTLMISRDKGGSQIVKGVIPPSITIVGNYGFSYNLADKELVLTWLRPFSEKVRNSKFNILAHRGGGRTSDRLPVSENSIAMINFTERLGSTGIEVDVRLTSDGIPFLYHDNDLNICLTQKGPIAGPPENYTFAQLSGFVRLIHGEQIPTLEEALTFTVDSTLLTFVYLDIKGDPGTIEKVAPIQQRMLERAAAKGRDLHIYYGIPNTDVLNELMNYPNYKSVPSLCELTVDDVRMVNAMVWAPRWTLGTQNDLVTQMHNEGRLAVCWTIDEVSWIREYVNNGLFDGLLTNYPYVVAYYKYIQQ